MSEMVKAAGEAGVDMIIDLVNHIIVEGVIPPEWELRSIVNYHKGKCDSLERGHFRGLKLADQILEIAKKIVKKLIKQQVAIDEMQLGFVNDKLHLCAPNFCLACIYIWRKLFIDCLGI